MAGFEGDGGAGKDPVYIMVSGGSAVEIFPLSYNIKDHCKMLGSPSETGLMQCDHKVIQPREVTFTGVLKRPYFKRIAGFRRSVNSMSLGTSLSAFVGKGGQVKKMFIVAFEEIGQNNRFDGVEVKFTMQEYLEHNRE